MTQELFEGTRHAGSPTRWQANHGNLLLGFVGIIMVIGAGILLYRQNRFVPPSFPEAKMIETPAEPPGDEPGEIEEMKVRVTGAVSENGSVRIAVYGSALAFEESGKPLVAKSAAIVEGQALWKIPLDRVPPTLAIAAFHDENSDGELNRNRFGIPTERYGFSRNARGLTGPPKYSQAEIKRPEAGETINLYIR